MKHVIELFGSVAHRVQPPVCIALGPPWAVANLVQAMTDLGYDGIDVDWEPITDADKPNVIVLLQKLRAAKPGVILTVPIGWSSVFDGTGAWFATLAPLTDQLNIMSYEMADAWPGWVSWHESALYGQGGDHPSSVSLVVSRYVSYGIPASKLGVGLTDRDKRRR